MSKLGRSPYASLHIPSTPRTVLAVALVWAAVTFSLSSLQSLIQSGPWLITGSVFVAIIAAITLLVRFTVTRFMTRVNLIGTLLPSLIGTLAGGWLILARFGGVEGRFDPWTTTSHAARLWAKVIEARTLTIAHIAPIEAFEPIVLIAGVGAGLVFVLADLLANGIRMPGLAALTLLPLWLPQLMLVPGTRFIEIVGVGLSLLLLLVVDNPYRTTPRFPDPASNRFRQRPLRWITLRVPHLVNSFGTVAAVVTGALGLSLIAPSLPIWGQADAPSLRNAGDQVRLSDTLDVRNSLGPRANNIVFRYTTDQSTQSDAGPLGPLRSATLTDFDGEVWTPSSTTHGSTVEPGNLLFPEPDVDVLEPFQVTMTFGDLRDTALPIPVEPRSLRAIQDAVYDPIRDVLELSSATSDGDQITIDTAPRLLTQEMLRDPEQGKDLTFPDNYRELAIEPALRLPDSPHLTDVIGFTTELTEGAPTNYDKALIMQNYLRDPNNFQYSLDLPERRTEDSVWDFLTDRTGYCVQFASAMTLMARTQGIPARMAVGFLPGQPSGSSEFVVRGRNAHAWTEIFFENVGWVRFEPTPAQQTGLSPEWAPDPSSSDPATPTPTQSVSPTTSEPTSDRPEERQTTSSAAAAPAGDHPGWADPDRQLPLLLGILGVLLLAILGRVALKRHRFRSLRGLEGGWTRVLAEATAAGYSIEEAATVRQVANLLEPAALGEAEGPIHELAHLVEFSRYAPQNSSPDLAPMRPQRAIDALVEEALESLARTVAAQTDSAQEH